ncbi:corticotropin-releasing factor receptor 1-like isoform X2 [Acanthaster planci]|uniref:Corticotropin-releasing factor receptor 1-like isoform X2 n=1 Tax=Acanthaster planci TaxID=133434 RepID=A0A8B7XHX4_ACAPL|nr:corticotropin-releasing factor receptor 1-like isoform X2 [Acanthaster planci]
MAAVPLPPRNDAATTPSVATTEYTEFATIYGTEEVSPGSENVTGPSDSLVGGLGSFDGLFDMANFSFENYFCDLTYRERTSELRQTGALFCNASHDKVMCWPPTPGGQNASLSCPVFNSSALRAYRACENTGNWAKWTDYTECLKTYTAPTIPGEPTHQSVSYIWLCGCILSLIFLVIMLFIFCYFKSLQCTRINIHKNLAVSFILKYICMIIQLSPTLSSQNPADEYYEGGDVAPIAKANDTSEHVLVFCRLLTVLLEYFTMANIFWMFVEGLFLTTRIAVAVFSNESNFKLYLLIGWGSPLLFINVWVVLMAIYDPNPCWEDYHAVPYIWLIRVPMIAAILVNSLFLINIIRILVTKLRASNTVETAQMRKSMKAVVVLFPLLGLTYLIFIWDDGGAVSGSIYHVVNAVLQSGQGVFVAVIYCFMNAEVRMAIQRRIAKSRYKFGSASRRRTHTNGSCVMATSSEVVLAVTFRKNVQGSTSIDQLSQEMKPFTECVER